VLTEGKKIRSEAKNNTAVASVGSNYTGWHMKTDRNTGCIQNSQVYSVDLVAEIFLRTNIISISSLLLEDVISLIQIKVLITVILTACNHDSSTTQPGQPSVGRCNEYQQKLRHIQAHSVMH